MPYGLTPQQKVLILVVMEDALAQLPNEGRCIGLNVLILVVMEEALAQVKIFSPISLG